MALKIVCIACAKPAIIIDHETSYAILPGPLMRITRLDIECGTCENTIRQYLVVPHMSEEQILSHPRHYTQVS